MEVDATISTQVKVITLRRRDHVRTLLSRITNRNTGLAHPSQKQAQVLANKKVRLRTEPKVLLRHLRIIERSYQQLGRFHEKIQKAGISAKMVYYEDLVQDPQALDRLRTFALNRRVNLHAIDAKLARSRGDTGSSPLDGASTAASSPRGTHWFAG